MTLPNITEKQKEIILLLYRFRFLNRAHIQKLLNHKNPIRTNQWLKDLVTKKYIDRIYSTKFGENTQPAKYYITKGGIRYLKTIPTVETKYLKKLYTESTKKEPFINRCFLVAEVFIKNRNNPLLKEFYTQSDYPADGPSHDLAPSFGFMIKHGKQTKDYICQVFETGKPPYVTEGIINKYIGFISEQEEGSIGVILISPTDKLSRYIWKFVQEQAEDQDIQVTTYSGIRELDLEELGSKK